MTVLFFSSLTYIQLTLDFSLYFNLFLVKYPFWWYTILWRDTVYALWGERVGMDVNLVLFKKNGAQKDFRLPSNVTVIGRRQDCDLCIPLMVVSRRHCEINKTKQSLMVRDLGSSNGTYLNGKRVTEAEVKPGDYLQIGPLAFGLQIDGTPEHIAVPDEMILQPPQPLSRPRQPQSSESDTFGGQGQFDSSEGRNATEIFEGLEDETNDGTQG
jgi:hypothetical protein